MLSPRGRRPSSAIRGRGGPEAPGMRRSSSAISGRGFGVSRDPQVIVRDRGQRRTVGGVPREERLRFRSISGHAQVVVSNQGSRRSTSPRHSQVVGRDHAHRRTAVDDAPRGPGGGLAPGTRRSSSGFLGDGVRGASTTSTPD